MSLMASWPALVVSIEVPLLSIISFVSPAADSTGLLVVAGTVASIS